jgi:hypothetical protein
MPDDRDAAYEHVGLDLAEAVIRAEFQVVLLCAAVAIRGGTGRDCAGLNGLIDSGDRRLAEMEAEQRELLVAGR